jgi:Flp pilus assembly protein TadD
MGRWIDRIIGAARHRGPSLSPGSEADELIESGFAALAAGDAERARQLVEQARRRELNEAGALLGLGRLASQAGDHAVALDALERAVAIAPHDAEALCALGIVLRLAGRTSEAEERFRAAIAIDPCHASAALNLGRLLIDRGTPQDAVEVFAGACQAHPAMAQLVEAHALALLECGRPEKAADVVDSYAGAEETATLAYLRGLASLNSGRTADATKWFRAALACDPKDARSHHALATALRTLGDAASAREHLRSLADAGVDDPDTLHELGAACFEGGDAATAQQCFERVTALAPELATAWADLGGALQAQASFARAAEALEHALALEPDLPGALSNIGLAYRELGETQKAVAALERCLALAPRLPGVRGNLAMTLADAGRLEESFALSDQVAPEDPAYPGACWNRATIRLAVGDYARGWQDYESRWNLSRVTRREIALPEWAGTCDPGTSVLVYAEQGLGDQIMFASCLPDALARAGRLVVECDPRLRALFQRSFADAQVVPQETGSPPSWLAPDAGIDAQIAIGSLPRLFRPDERCFPRHAGYLAAAPERVAAWRDRLAKLGPGLKVGLSWRGGLPTTRRNLRSLDLASLAPLLRGLPAHFVSLQYGDCTAEIESLDATHGIRVLHWREAIDDYDETAALVSALDLVITVCTSIVHLGGALGRPVRVLVPTLPEWRYGRAGNEMIWYPSVRLYRQRRRGEWGDVFETLARELRTERFTGR